jgi:hypothetical protein
MVPNARRDVSFGSKLPVTCRPGSGRCREGYEVSRFNQRCLRVGLGNRLSVPIVHVLCGGRMGALQRPHELLERLNATKEQEGASERSLGDISVCDLLRPPARHSKTSG